jgi:ribosomal protein S21
MATNVSVERNNNENSLGVLRRFTKRVQGAGILNRVRGLRYAERELSFYKRKMKTLESIAYKANQATLIKQGKIPAEPVRKKR